MVSPSNFPAGIPHGRQTLELGGHGQLNLSRRCELPVLFCSLAIKEPRMGVTLPFFGVPPDPMPFDFHLFVPNVIPPRNDWKYMVL